MAGVIAQFPTIYQTSDDGYTDSEGEEEDVEEGVQEKQEENNWGITPLLIAVAKETMTPLHDIYSWAITEFLYYASYYLEMEQRKIREIKKIQFKK